jgi:hypothetical protein
MFPHPETDCAVREMDRQRALADAARARLAQQAQVGALGGSYLHIAVRRYLGTVLVVLGTRLQGAQDAGSMAAAAPASSFVKP